MTLTLSDGLAIVLVGLSQALGHWIPWHLVPALVDERRQLLRPFAYVYGCLWIWLGFLVYALSHPTIWPALWFLALLIVAAGLGTMAPRAIHEIGEARRLRADRRDLERTLGQTDET